MLSLSMRRGCGRRCSAPIEIHDQIESMTLRGDLAVGLGGSEKIGESLLYFHI